MSTNQQQKLEEKLNVLEISERDLQLYSSTFIQDRTRYLINEAGQGWKEAKTRNDKNIPLTSDLVASHLLGKHTVATVGPKKTQQFCVIIECVRGLRPFYEKIITYLQTPLVFFNSGTEHLFFYTHLDFSISSEKLPLVLSFELDRIGLRRCPAPYRIFPGICEFLRLPLGKESFMVDPQTLHVAFPGSEVKAAIEFIRTRLRVLRFSELFPGVKNNAGYPNHRGY
jgi:hypothetical protein